MSRIVRGFHRLGLFLAVPQLSLAAILFVIRLVSTAPDAPTFYGIFLLITGTLCYALARGIAWVIEGFASGATPKSPGVRPMLHMNQFEPAFAGDPSSAPGPVIEFTAPPVRGETQVIKREISGIGGWLIFPALGTLACPFLLGKSVYDTFHGVLSIPPGFTEVHLFAYGELACNIMLFTLSVFACYFMYLKSTYFPKIYVALGVIAVFVVVADAIIGLHFDVPITDADNQVIGRTLGNGFIWVPYMLLSKRVKNTFVQP